MAATKLKVTYLDGREVIVKATPKAQVETERYLGGITVEHQVEGSMFLAWASMRHRGEDVAKTFEAWLDDIEDAEEYTEDEAPRPTEEAQSPVNSSD